MKDLKMFQKKYKSGRMLLAKELLRPFISHLPHTDDLIFYRRLSIKVHKYPKNLERALKDHQSGRPLEPIVFAVRDESTRSKKPIILIEWKPKVGFVVKWLCPNGFSCQSEQQQGSSVSNGTSVSGPSSGSGSQFSQVLSGNVMSYGSNFRASLDSDGIPNDLTVKIMKIVFATNSRDVLCKIQHPTGVTFYKVHETADSSSFEIRSAPKRRGGSVSSSSCRDQGTQSEHSNPYAHLPTNDDSPNTSPRSQFTFCRRSSLFLNALLCCGCISDHSVTTVLESGHLVCEILPKLTILEKNVTLVNYEASSVSSEGRAVCLAVAFIVHLTTVHPELQATLDATK